MSEQQTQGLRLEHVKQYLAIGKAMLDDAGIPCRKWYKAQSDHTSNYFAWPVLLHNNRECAYRATAVERRLVEQTPEYKNFAHYPDRQKLLITEAENQVLQIRADKGENLRAMARQLGHQEVEGKFAFHEDHQRDRFTIGVDCLLCGIRGHDIPQCSSFLIAYQSRHSQSYRGQATRIIERLTDDAPSAPLPSSDDDSDDENASDGEASIEEEKAWTTNINLVIQLNERLNKEHDTMIDLMGNPDTDVQMLRLQQGIIDLIKSKLTAVKEVSKRDKQLEEQWPIIGTYEENIISIGIQRLPDDVLRAVWAMIKGEVDMEVRIL